MLVGRWVPATGRHISRSRRTTSTYFENGSRTHTQKLTANYHLPRNVCVYKVDLGALAERTLPVVTHYPCVYSSGVAERARQINQTLGFRSSATPPCADLSHLLCYVPRPYIPPQNNISWGLPRPCITLVMIFFSCDQSNPPHPLVEPCALGRWVWVWQSCWFGHAPHTLSSQQNPPN